MHTLSAIELKERFLKGETTAVSIAKYFLERVQKHDKSIGAFLRVYNVRMLDRAEKLDLKRSRGEKLGKLAGIPIAVKDNIHVLDELSTCGSKFLSNYVAPFNSTAVRLVEEQDALIIGKTNMDEFAMGSSTENSAFQKTYNPWNVKCTPGGSSGGSAAAVAGRLCPISFGSDTGGSIRQPASFCGIVGYKPTYGRVSRYGLVAFGSSLDQIGPFATNTADAALVMEVIGQRCEKDSTCIPSGPDDYFSTLRAGVNGMKIGVPWDILSNLNEESFAHFKQSIDTFKTMGAQIVNVNLELMKYAIPVYYILATAEASTNLARFDGIRYGIRSQRAKTLDEVYDFSKEEGFGTEVKRRILLGTYVLSAGYQDAYYKKAQKVRTLMIRQFKEAFQTCSLIATPVTTGPAFEIGAIKDPLQMYLNDIFTISSNLAGIPTISVPSGFSADHRPIGLQLLGPQKQDTMVFQAAHAFEQAVGISHMIPELFIDN